jgi:hypothetical protein
MLSRADVIRLAERLTSLEMRLADLEAKLEEGERSGAGSSSTATRVCDAPIPAPRRIWLHKRSATRGGRR